LIVHIANIHLHDDQPKSVADGYWT